MRHAHSPPTARTWVGNHGNNDITNSNNWSPAGEIGPADTLTMTTGTMNITGTQLSSTDELSVSGASIVNVANGRNEHFLASDNATINLTNSDGIFVRDAAGNITINTLGQNELHVQTIGRGTPGSVTINNNGSLLEGGLAGFGAKYTVNGGLFANEFSWAGLDSQTVVINADVIGQGLWQVSSYHSPGAGHLEFVKSVSDLQTVALTSSVGWDHLQIDQPSQFHAAIQLLDKAEIDLVGLAADSYRYNPTAGILDFYAGNNVVDSLRLTSTLADGFGVSAGTSTGGAGVEIYSHLGPPGIHPHGAELPVHA